MNGITELYISDPEFRESALERGMLYTGSASPEFVEEWLERDHTTRDMRETAREAIERTGRMVD